MAQNKFYTTFSYNICLRTLIRADHTNTILLRVIIGRVKKDYNLNISWPEAFFNKNTGLAQQRFKNDKEAESVNLVINQATSKAHYIKMRAFAQSKSLTHEDFSREFEHYESKENFIWYWRQKMNKRYNDEDITAGTFRHHKSSLDHVLTAFLAGKQLCFSDLTTEFLQKYEVWLRKKYMHNTVWGHIKNVKTYINLAIKDGYSFKNPLEDYRNLRFRDGFREALDTSEINKLIKLLTKPILPVQRSVLERFLFSCFTGIRISDVSRVSIGNIHNGLMSVKMKKGERYGKVVQIPLPKVAQNLIAGRSGRIFEPLADQTCNDTLKIIAGITGINKPILYKKLQPKFFLESLDIICKAYPLFMTKRV